MEKPKGEIPVINVGRYAGTPIDKLPSSYLRWMLSQDFPPAWMAIAKAKVGESEVHNEWLSVSKHSIDRFSIRFIRLWQDYLLSKHSEHEGIATFLMKLAEIAWREGKDVSKDRHKDDGIIKLYKGVKYVFAQGKQFPEYIELITVMD